MKRPAVTNTVERRVPPLSLTSIRETLDAILAMPEPGPLKFEVSVSASMPAGFGSLTRMENGEMKVLWAGRLTDIGNWPAGAKLWVHRDDYDRMLLRAPAG